MNQFPSDFQSNTSPDYDCENTELGLGKKSEEKTGICRSGFKGNITYRCDSPYWTPVQDNCVLKVIDNLKIRVEVIYRSCISISVHLAILNVSNIYIFVLCNVGLDFGGDSRVYG